MWGRGDRAICIGRGEWFTRAGRSCEGPKRGQVLEVCDIRTYGPDEMGLNFQPWRDGYFDHRCFKKLEPYTPTEEDEEVVRLYGREPAHT